MWERQSADHWTAREPTADERHNLKRSRGLARTDDDTEPGPQAPDGPYAGLQERLRADHRHN